MFISVDYIESLKKYLTLVLAGLAGSPRMVSCTLLALAKLLYEFHGIKKSPQVTSFSIPHCPLHSLYFFLPFC